MLETVQTVIVDEVHAVVATKRGAHLALSLACLDALAGKPLRRIALSATQRPIDEVARYLCGEGPCHIVDMGHQRAWDWASCCRNARSRHSCQTRCGAGSPTVSPI